MIVAGSARHRRGRKDEAISKQGEIAIPPRRRGAGTRPTIADVAARAGVGAITVSRALRTPELVSEKLRRSIRAAIEALNYIPDLNARALASVRTDVVGVLVPSLSHTLFTDVLRGISDGIDGSHLQMQIGNTHHDPKTEERLIAGFLRQKPAAMILSGTDQTAAARAALERAGCPVVQIMDLCADPVDVVIGFSHQQGGRLITEHLIEEGYRRIAFLIGWMNDRSEGRLLGYRMALRAAGLPEPRGVHAMSREELSAIAARSAPSERPILDYSPPSLGRELFRRARAAAPDIDAVFCNNDSLALGVLFECLETGIRVPEEMGIAGFNDLDFMSAAHPSLSSVRTHRYRIGRRAIETIAAALAGGKGERIVDLGVDVVRRQSTSRRAALARAGAP